MPDSRALTNLKRRVLHAANTLDWRVYFSNVRTVFIVFTDARLEPTIEIGLRSEPEFLPRRLCVLLSARVITSPIHSLPIAAAVREYVERHNIVSSRSSVYGLSTPPEFRISHGLSWRYNVAAIRNRTKIRFDDDNYWISLPRQTLRRGKRKRKNEIVLLRNKNPNV